jgi:hypothetical protein
MFGVSLARSWGAIHFVICVICASYRTIGSVSFIGTNQIDIADPVIEEIYAALQKLEGDPQFDPGNFYLIVRRCR